MTIESAVSFQERFSPSVLSFREKEFQAVLVNVSIQGRRPLAASTFYFELLLFLSLPLSVLLSGFSTQLLLGRWDRGSYRRDIKFSACLSLPLFLSLDAESIYTVARECESEILPLPDRGSKWGNFVFFPRFSPKFRQFRGFNCHQTKFRKISFRGGDGIHFRDENFVELFRERRKDEIVE